MSTSRTSKFAFFTEYADQSDDDSTQDEIVIPETFEGVSDEDLSALHEQAVGAFNALYGDHGAGLTEDGLSALGVLTDGVERITAEMAVRETVAAERQEAAAALAARVTGEEMSVEPPVEDDDKDAEDPDADPEDEDKDETEAAEPEALASKEIRINLSGLRSHQASTPPPVNVGAPTSMRDIVKANSEFGTEGAGLDWEMIGNGLDRRLASFNVAQWQQAQAADRHMRQQLGMVVINKPFEPGLMITNDSPIHHDQVLTYATRESRLPGNSLVAAGGWCAPSTVIYDLCEMETRDGMFSLPEIGITRGGVQTTLGPNWADIYALGSFHYTEEQDIAGEYGVDANGVGNDTAGDKPCFRVDCPDFTDHRLEYDGLCITAGLLQMRGYPEMLARVTRGALVAHDHRLASRSLAGVVAGSTAVTMPASQIGATAPLLTAIELQVEHYRSVNRSSRTGSLEAVFPFWVHGAIRSDLARRLGVDLIDVSNARIDSWFANAGVSPQFVYGLQDLTGAATAATAWPATVKFLLYAAGTWVRGVSPIITLDTIYDSVLLGQNDFTALFTEEGSLVLQTCHDSRAVTVAICPDGATHGGVEIDCDGTVAA